MIDLQAELKANPDVTECLVRHGVRTVIVGGCDTYGVMRGKRVPVEQLARVLRHGMALCDVFWVMHIDESALVERPSGHIGYFPTEERGYPDIVVKPDLGTLRLVPWHEDTALLLGDWHLPHGGGPVPIAPRTILSRVLDQTRQMGYEPLSALELEFYLLRESVGTWHHKRPQDLVPLWEAPSTYGVVLGSQQDIGSVIRHHMMEYGLPIEACNPETGPGQFELNLRYGDSLKAADDAFLFKSAVKEVAAQHDLLASFMAKPTTAWAGNSCHAHMSLRDEQGRGCFYDAGQEHGMSETMRHFAAGVLATMPEFTALMAPNVNSYRRFVPYSWAGTTATWGIDNRSVGLRAICEGEDGTRLEQRQAGGDANPYLVTAALLAGGMQGIADKAEPPPLTDADAYAMSADQAPPLPVQLPEAVDLLERSATARTWFGDDFVDYYVEMQRSELRAQAVAVTDWEVARFLGAM